MDLLYFIKEYWVIITFLLGILTTLIVFIKSMIDATKCSLRNDILTIYDRCKDDKTITKDQLEAINHSADIYFKLKGNSFVKDVVEKVKKFELVD